MTNLSIDCRYCPTEHLYSMKQMVGQDYQQAIFNPFDPYGSGKDIGKTIPFNPFDPYGMGKSVITPTTPTTKPPGLIDKIESTIKNLGVSLEHAALYWMIGAVTVVGIFAYWSYKTDVVGKAKEQMQKTIEENKRTAMKLAEKTI